MAELTQEQEDEILNWENAPDWMKRMLQLQYQDSNVRESQTLSGQYGLAKGMGTRFGVQDYLDVTTALNNFKVSGENKVNALRRVMGRTGSFKLPTGGLSSTSIKSLMDLQGKDILAGIIEMQSNANLKTLAEQRDWYTAMELDPYYFQDSRKAFKSMLEAQRGERTDLDAQIQSKVNAEVFSAYEEGLITKDKIDAWLEDSGVPAQYRPGALEQYYKLTGESRSKAKEIRSVETQALEVKAKKDAAKKRDQESFVASEHKDAARQVIALVTGNFVSLTPSEIENFKIDFTNRGKALENGMSITEAMSVVIPRYDEIDLFKSTTVEELVEAQVGTRGERKGAKLPGSLDIDIQEQTLNIPRFELTEGGQFQERKEGEIEKAQYDSQRIFILEMRDRDSKNPLRNEIHRTLREAAVWDHIRQIKGLNSQSRILDSDIVRLKKEIEIVRDKSDPVNVDDDIAYWISRFAKRYGIPFNMALYLSDEKGYIGPLSAVRQ